MGQTQRSEVAHHVVISFRLPREEGLRLRAFARADDRPVSNVARRLVLTGLRQITDQKQAGVSA